MKKGLPTKTVEEICDCLIDYRGKTPRKTDSGVKLITAKVIKGGRIEDSDHEYIAEDEYDSWMRRGLPQAGDVLVTTEAPLGEVAPIPADERVALAQRVILMRANPEICDPKYLLYVFQSRFVQAELTSRASGCTVVGIKNVELRKVRVPLPGLSEQEQIGRILSAYDEQMENNRRRMGLLEKAAHLLYEEWFVRLRFPGHEHTPVTRGLPQGWERKPLNAICPDLREAANPADLEPGTPYIGLEHMPRRSITLLEWGTAEDVTSTKLRYLAGDILFGKIRPYFHKVGFALTDGVTSSDAIVLRPSEPLYYIFSLLTVSSQWFVNIASKTAKEGSKMPAPIGI